MPHITMLLFVWPSFTADAKPNYNIDKYILTTTCAVFNVQCRHPRAISLISFKFWLSFSYAVDMFVSSKLVINKSAFQLYNDSTNWCAFQFDQQLLGKLGLNPSYKLAISTDLHDII